MMMTVCHLMRASMAFCLLSGTAVAPEREGSHLDRVERFHRTWLRPGVKYSKQHGSLILRPLRVRSVYEGSMKLRSGAIYSELLLLPSWRSGAIHHIYGLPQSWYIAEIFDATRVTQTR